MNKNFSRLAALALAAALSLTPAAALELEDAKQLLAEHCLWGLPPAVQALDSLDDLSQAIGDPYTFYLPPAQSPSPGGQGESGGPGPSVSWALRDGAAWVACEGFREDTPGLMEEAVTRLESKAGVFLVDLRDNPGGSAAAAAQAAGLFTGGGPALYFQGRDGRFQRNSLPMSYPDLTDKPVILLLDSGSASGAELFAAAIRDRGAGIALGQRTYGKGIAQQTFSRQTHPDLFQPGEALQITTYRFFSPEGVSNDILGVLPTLAVAPEYAEEIALLLSCPGSPAPENHLLLELAGQRFFVDLNTALEEAHRPALTHLLEALPPSAAVRHSAGKNWEDCPPLSPARLAEELGLEDYTSRALPNSADSPCRRELDTLAAYGLTPRPWEDAPLDGELTRGEFAALLTLVVNPYSAPGGQFTDVPRDHPLSIPIHAVAHLGLLSGYEDGSFRPDEPLTCQQLVCALAAMAAWVSMDCQLMTRAGLDATGLWDAGLAPFAPWARPSAWLLDWLEVGLPGLDPGQPVTREQAAALVCRLLERTGLIWA